MLVLLLSVSLIVVAAALVLTYVAYPQRGRDVPRVLPGGRRLSAGMQKVVDRAGLDPDTDEAAHGGALGQLSGQRRTGADAGRDN